MVYGYYTSSITVSSACRCTFGSEFWLLWSRDTAMKEIYWLPIADRIKYKLCLMMHVAVNNRRSAYITDTLVPTSSLLHRERLRLHESGGFKVPRVRTEFGRRAFSIASPMVWNELLHNIRRTGNVTTFKRVLKAYLFKHDCWRFFSSLKCLVKRRWTMFG